MKTAEIKTANEITNEIPAKISATFVQPKLSVGQPDDHYEKEADAVADKVISTPENFVQRKCAHCEEEEKKQVQRKPISQNISTNIQAKGEAGISVSNSVSNKINSSQGSGSSMDRNTQSFMSSRFGNDFSNVKIHTDGDAIQMNRELNAKAFTVGNDVYFNEGEYQPASESGKHLLAHELVHTIQQKDSKTLSTIQRVILTYDDGPDANTQATLSALKTANAKATFYLVGQKIQQSDNWKIVFDIAASGNWLGNHAFDWDFTKEDHIFMSGDFDERVSKILQTEFAIRDALIKGKTDAQTNKKWDTIPESYRKYIDDVISTGTGRFRTPGFRSHFYSPGASQQNLAFEVVNKIMADAGLRPFKVSDSVTIDPKDWEKGKTQADVEKSVTGDLKSDSDSILLHSRLGISAAATPAILADIKNKKFSYQEPDRGTASVSGSGFGNIKSRRSWINTYFWMNKIGPAVTVNKTDPIDRTVTTQTGVAWIDFGSESYLAIISMENSSIQTTGTTITFLAFIDKDLKDKVTAKATPNQPKGIQTIAKKYISNVPASADPDIAKK